MKRIRRLDQVTETDRGASAAIGNFDGVHLGHRTVLERARAAGHGAPLAVLTFEPHPREVFRPDDPPFRLMSADARAHRLEKIGVDLLFELPFDAALRGMTAEEFAGVVLQDGLGLTHVTVGNDFRYGKGRLGSPETLIAAGETHGFGVTIAAMASAVRNGPRISSSAIREALKDGRPEDAAQMLGHWHRIEGAVIHGEKRGRSLGYPTANMDVSGLMLPRFGVYAVLADVLDGPHAGSYRGAASLGVRPMFGENRPNLETYLFDFSGDLYGATISVGLVAFLRPEARFDGVDALISQMDADCARARDVLASLA